MSVLESIEGSDSATPTATDKGVAAGLTVFVLTALLLSGIAAIINQTVWQRALKVFLAGSEAISSMIVVLVFMLGLGLGSFHMGRSAARVRNPLRTLGFVELGLLAINLLIAFVLSRDIAESANTLQRAAMSLGMPLRILYALVSTAVLIVPCYLMGITMPLVSEASQRQLQTRDSGFLTTLFFLNTLGAVLGGLASGFFLMPFLGQRKSLIIAAALNGIAGLILVLLRARSIAATAHPAVELPDMRNKPVTGMSRRVAGLFGFALGFLALAYEMYAFRMAALTCQPLPYTFSAVLCFYLLIWSLGLFAARFLPVDLPTTLGMTGALVILMPQLLDIGWYAPGIIGVSVYFCIPCFGFGLAFGKLVTASAENWGNDVGRFYFMNTIGSCLGILAATLAGYQVHPMFLCWSVGLGYLIMAIASRSADRTTRPIGRFALITGAIVLIAWIVPASDMIAVRWKSSRPGSSSRMYFGPEGVVEVQHLMRRGVQVSPMLWDGLWHSDLSNGRHVGTNNWLLGSIPYMCHPPGENMKALVIGMGTGITVKTLALYPRVESVEVYEINGKLKQLLADFPAGTLNVGTDPKVHINWSDGRTGLILSDKKYDIITQQPTYLKQAGSSILLSREYMQLIKEHLNPGGIFCIYCNSIGNQEQAAVVRRTAADVFKHGESFGRGYMLLVSDTPFDYNRKVIDEKIADLPKDSAAYQETMAYGPKSFFAYFDNPPLDWATCPVRVTDDHPVVEYPGVASYLVGISKKIPR